MPAIPKDKLPAYVRECYELHKKHAAKNRAAAVERLKFYVGGDLQWRDVELTKRRNQGRPWVTINKCKPAVDQIEGDIRLNPPGPQCHPVGGGADKDTADILEGIIREIEYRSGAKTAYSTAAKYSAAGGEAYIELATEYTSERSFAQQLRIDSIEDPATVFLDPTARRANRQDAAWGGKIRTYTRSEYIGEFGSDRKVLKGRGTQAAMGWIQDALGIDGSVSQINEWTGYGKGPYYVVEFYMVEVEPAWLRLYTDNVNRFDDEKIPKGVRPKEGDEYSRQVPRRTIHKYVVDALETLDEGDWPGDLIPIFPVLGPEIYIDGQLHRLSLIAGAIDSQRALNYVATTMTELTGLLPKSPMLGPKGSFDDPKWETLNSEMWAYMEYTPVFVTDETTGAQQLAPPPTRNTWEAPIQWLVLLAGYFSDAIKAVTSIYDPSLGQQKGDQSGKAIEQLRSESNVGNFSYADNLHRGIEVLYNQIARIAPKILDGPRAQTIVRADSQHEIALINQIFPGGIDPATGKKGKANNICLGQYSVRCVAAVNFDERNEKAVAVLTEFFKACPQALAAPGVAAAYLRLVGDGNPKVEQMADLMEPPDDSDVSPQQMQQKLQQAQQQNQALTQIVQQMQQAIQAKLPEIEAKKWIAALEAITKIRTAEITASKDLDKAAGDREAALLEMFTGMAHDVAQSTGEQAHEASQSQQEGERAQQAQASDQAHESAQGDKAAIQQQVMQESQQAHEAAQQPAEGKS